MSYLYLAAAVALTLLARAAVRRPHRHPPLWVTALAGSELAGWFLVVTVLMGIGVRSGAGAPGVVGGVAQGFAVLAAVGFVVALGRGFAAAATISAAVAEFTGHRLPLRWSRLGAVVTPISRPPRRVTVDVGLRYGEHERHLVDRVGPPPQAGRRPALIYVHGGGWWRGRRDTQARPMIHRLARSGWQVFTPSHRLSPEATFPDHLIDIKRVIAWVRENAARLGVDPAFVAIAGGSAGGNLAALAALDADTALQPGFASADTSVQACVPLYGVHDLLDDNGRPLWPYLETAVIKAAVVDDPALWRRASPIRMATERRPPFFVVHGGADTLVRPELSRRLVAALRAAGGPPVGHLEVPWGNHGFDFFAGPRGRATAAAVEVWLERTYAEHRERVGG
jgi:acetyl esterase/lipase